MPQKQLTVEWFAWLANRLPEGQTLSLSGWALDFCLWLHQFPDLLNVFLGAGVHKNPNVKLEASAGCQEKDSVRGRDC